MSLGQPGTVKYMYQLAQYSNVISRSVCHSKVCVSVRPV